VIPAAAGFPSAWSKAAAGMSQGTTKAQWKMLFIRVILGLVCAVVLIRLFLPGAGVGAISVATLLLVFFAYVFEAVRRR
jgi:hypothetical protein